VICIECARFKEMSPFWASLFDHLKDCGRNATIFIITLGCLFVLIVVVAIICANNLQQYLVRALPVLALLPLAWTWSAFRLARRRRHESNSRHPLSQDELRVARSKLTKVRSPRRS